MIIVTIILCWILLGVLGSYLYKFDEEARMMGLKHDWVWVLMGIIYGPFSIYYAIRFNRRVKKEREERKIRDEKLRND